MLESLAMGFLFYAFLTHETRLDNQRERSIFPMFLKVVSGESITEEIRKIFSQMLFIIYEKILIRQCFRHSFRTWCLHEFINIRNFFEFLKFGSYFLNFLCSLWSLLFLSKAVKYVKKLITFSHTAVQLLVIFFVT